MGKHTAIDARRDTRRAFLAEKIAHRDELAASVAALKVAHPTAQRRVWEMRSALETAEAGIASAKTAAADHFVAVTIGEACEAPGTLEAARQRKSCAQDDLDIARTALETVTRRLTEDELALRLVETKVKDAARDVLRQCTGIASLIADVERVQRELVDKSIAVEWLEGHGLTDATPVQIGLLQSRVPAAEVVQRYRSPPNTWNALVRDPTIDGAKLWEAALAALMSDPDAPLPDSQL